LSVIVPLIECFVEAKVEPQKNDSKTKQTKFLIAL